MLAHESRPEVFSHYLPSGVYLGRVASTMVMNLSVTICCSSFLHLQHCQDCFRPPFQGLRRVLLVLLLHSLQRSSDALLALQFFPHVVDVALLALRLLPLVADSDTLLVYLSGSQSLGTHVTLVRLQVLRVESLCTARMAN